MKVALYVRVSTDRQEAGNQTDELRAWAFRLGHTIVAEYEDIASGARRRERLDDLFDDARRHKFDLVATWSLDRLTREGPLATLLYLQRLTAMGVRVYSHQEAYLNPELPFYESIVAFLADIARWERLRISERTKAGQARARTLGHRIGRHPKDCRCKKHWRGQRPVPRPARAGSVPIRDIRRVVKKVKGQAAA